MKRKFRIRALLGSLFQTKACKTLRFSVLGLFLTCFIQFFSLQGVYAQSAKHVVTGKVVAAIDQTPLPGANVVIKGNINGTVTDVDGNYSIEVSDNDVLIFSFVGYHTETVDVAGKTTINVSLVEDITRLEEVVKVGYGTMRRSDLTGSVTSVTENDVKRSVATSLDQVLQGRAAGVTVTQNSGTPGGSVSVRIRGINSIGSDNEPLYVIDGVPMDGYSGTKSSNALSMINPSDIVSMDILKDASATAIYGSRASNGVILITTKQGKAGKTQVSYNAYYGIQQLPNRLETMNLQDYARFYNERAAIRGFDSQVKFDDPSVLGNGTNWQDELFRSAPMQSHQLSLTGGSDKSTFAFSAGYFTQDGIAVGSGFDRYTMRMRLDNKPTSWFNFGANILAGKTKQVVTASDNTLINMALRQTPDVPVKNLDGSWGGPSPNIYGTYTTNPIAEALSRENYNTGTQLISNIYAEINFLKYFTFRNEIGGTIGYNNNYYFQPNMTMGQYTIQSNGSRSAGTNTYWILKNYLTYARKIGMKHDVSMMLGHESQETAWDGVSGSVTNYISNDVHELPNGDASTAKNSSFKGASSQESYFGRLTYSFADKYLLTATMRADGSSKFGPKNKWGYFPSAALAWKINKESFMTGFEKISNLKLRLGYGQVGGQNISDGAYFARLNSSQSLFGPGQLPANIANPYVKWEATTSYNAGLDLGLFANRIELITDVYLKTTSDLLIQVPLPAYAGTNGTGAMQSPMVNIGGLQNKGIEFTLNTVNVDHNNFYWKSGIVFSLNRNKITKLNNPDAVIYGYSDNGTSNGTVLITKSAVGDAIGQFYGYQVIGMFNKESDFYTKDKNGNTVPVALPDQKGKYGIKPGEIWVGDFIYKDQNGDGTIDEQDRTYLGNPEPKFEYGFNNYFSYKNFDLNIYLQGVYGNKVYNMTRSNFDDPNSNLGMLKEVMNYARIGLIDPNVGSDVLSNVEVTNPGNGIPRINLTDYNDNGRISNRFVEDGSYLRIKNIVLGYNLPKNWMNKIKFNSARVYMNVQNLYTFTKYKGYDPEIGLQRQNVLVSAIDQGRYPSQRIWTFGIDVNF